LSTKGADRPQIYSCTSPVLQRPLSPESFGAFEVLILVGRCLALDAGFRYILID
jgi:hypothetical protein